MLQVRFNGAALRWSGSTIDGFLQDINRYLLQWCRSQMERFNYKERHETRSNPSFNGAALRWSGSTCLPSFLFLHRLNCFNGAALRWSGSTCLPSFLSLHRLNCFNGAALRWSGSTAGRCNLYSMRFSRCKCANRGLILITAKDLTKKRRGENGSNR